MLDEDRLELFAAVLEAIDQALFITDPEGLTVEANAACCALYGYSRREILGNTLKLLNPLRELYEELGYSGESYDKLFSGLWSGLRDPAVGRWEGTVVDRKKDGCLIWVKLRVTARRDGSGQLRNFIVLPTDISMNHDSEARSRVQLYRTMAGLADLRDNGTTKEARRIGLMARMLAGRCGKSNKYCDDIEMFAPMHDIGNIGILNALLRAPRRLTQVEFEQMRQHTILGHNIVKGDADLEMMAAIALNHHERWDGAGYPNGLAGSAIPLSARITAIVDVYDALRSARPHRPARTHAAAVAEILEQAGHQFDPNLTDYFREIAAALDSVFNELKD